jgi:predicted RNase H-like HicB family nuclease
MKKQPPKTKIKPVRYLVIIRGTSTGYSADVPHLPGCFAAAKTMKSVRRLIAEAIGLHIDLMEISGERVPPPRHCIEFSVDDSSTDEELCTWVDVKFPEAVSRTA